MGNSLRLYLRYAGISIRGQMQYRGSFLTMAVGHFLVTGIEFLGIWALFDRFGALRGWSLPEVALLYGIVSVAFALAEGIGRGFDLFAQMVQTGEFDRLLLRPRSTAFQVAATELQLMRLGRLLQGLFVLLWAVFTLEVGWTVPRVALLLAAVLSGACIFYGLFVLQATMAFWTVETQELVNCFTYGGNETAQYPMSVYRPWFRRFFTFVVPLACASYLPAHAILGRPGPDGVPTALLWLAPLAGAFFLAACLQLWRIGVRHYTSTGS